MGHRAALFVECSVFGESDARHRDGRRRISRGSCRERLSLSSSSVPQRRTARAWSRNAAFRREGKLVREVSTAGCCCVVRGNTAASVVASCRSSSDSHRHWARRALAMLEIREITAALSTPSASLRQRHARGAIVGQWRLALTRIAALDRRRYVSTCETIEGLNRSGQRTTFSLAARLHSTSGRLPARERLGSARPRRR